MVPVGTLARAIAQRVRERQPREMVVAYVREAMQWPRPRAEAFVDTVTQQQNSPTFWSRFEGAELRARDWPIRIAVALTFVAMGLVLVRDLLI